MTTPTTDGIRTYPHPGKFQRCTLPAIHAYYRRLDGSDETIPSVDGMGKSYTMTRGPLAIVGTIVVAEDIRLNDAEVAFLAETAGAIVSEDEQGFVEAEFYDDAETMESDWAEILAEYPGDDDDNDTEANVKGLAEIARCHMEQRTRKDDDKAAFWTHKEDAPAWVQAMCMDAHGDMVPDDHRYAFIVDALDLLADADDPDDCEPEADIYTSDLCKWLASDITRPGYCDEAAEQYGLEAADGIVKMMEAGQLAERREVLGLVRQWLEDHADDITA